MAHERGACSTCSEPVTEVSLRQGGGWDGYLRAQGRATGGRTMRVQAVAGVRFEAECDKEAAGRAIVVYGGLVCALYQGAHDVYVQYCSALCSSWQDSRDCGCNCGGAGRDAQHFGSEVEGGVREGGRHKIYKRSDGGAAEP